MENLTGISAPVRPLPCVVPCKLYFKVFKRTIGKTLLGVVILLTVNVIILVLTNATTVLIFVAAVLYIVYLVQTIVNIRKF